MGEIGFVNINDETVIQTNYLDAGEFSEVLA